MEKKTGNVALIAGPAFTGSLAYVVNSVGYLMVMDAKDGSLLEKHYINSEQKPGAKGLCLSAATVVGGRIYVGSETGGLRCLSGKP